jgi:putative DNA primase/helicase
MIRRRRDQYVRPWVYGELIERDVLRPIRRKLKRWVLDNADALRAAHPVIPQALYVNDRAVDIWRPLLAIAAVVGGEWPERARNAAVTLTNRAMVEAPESDTTELLRNIRSIFYPAKPDGTPDEPKDVLDAAVLCAKLTSRDEWKWATYNNGKPLPCGGRARDVVRAAR